MSEGIRPGIWMAAVVAVVAALAILRLASPGVGGESNRQPTRVVSLDRSSTASTIAPIGVHPTIPLLPAPLRPASERVDVPRDGVAAPPSAPRARALERPQPADSRVASDLRVVEDDAARRAESLGLSPSPSSSGLAAAQLGASDEDARRGALAEAFLVDQIVQEALRSNEYPFGYPAEARERAFAESLVRGADAEARSNMLERALQQPPAERVAPHFSDQIWEGALY